MSEYYIGCLTGTSIDAVDCALVAFSNINQFRLQNTYSQKIPDNLQDRLHTAALADTISFSDLGELNALLGELIAQGCLTLLEQSQIKASQITAIGSHGQTIHHAPNHVKPFTIQIGDPNIIAARTDILTIADFRGMDMALGGQGAPLTPIFHHYLFGDPAKQRIIVNIGGIANITLLTGKDYLGFDSGPGNTLLDSWISLNKDCPYDLSGEWARSGQVIAPLLTAMLQCDYFKAPPPKSTGRELFNPTWLEKHIKNHGYPPEDVQATLTELTAQTITDAIYNIAPTSNEIILCGGGAFNTYLLSRIQHLNPKASVVTTEQFDIPPNWVEAMAFAWFAYCRMHNTRLDTSSSTGAYDTYLLGNLFKK